MARRQKQADAGTASRILDIAERLVQVRGFNGFSYADIASELKISKASLHYHFPGKAELGEALIRRYAARFADELEAIEPVTMTHAPSSRPTRHLRRCPRDRRMCLCGMLAAEYETLPKPMRDAIIGFFDQNEAWLTRRARAGSGGGGAALQRIRERGGADDRQWPRGCSADRTALRGRGPLQAAATRLLRELRHRSPGRHHCGRLAQQRALSRPVAAPRKGCRRAEGSRLGPGLL